MNAVDTAKAIHTLSFNGESHGERRETKAAFDDLLEVVAFDGVAVHLAIANLFPATPVGLQFRKLLIENCPQSRHEFEAFMLELLYHLEAACGWSGMYRSDFQGGGK
jgi:hypothetical protein